MANIANIAMLAEIDGALLVDKPSGFSCHDLMKAVKTKFNLVKVGHGGTVDVTASGLFVLLLGDATRFSNDLAGSDKSWEVKIALGRETDTCDRAGTLLKESAVPALTHEDFEKVLREFRGDVYQSPPEFSAVKIPGKSGYEIVRTAEGDGLREKLVHVYKYAITSFEPPTVGMGVVATKGVSVRALARDIGRAIGCGAVVEECRRTKCGKFAVENAVPFMKLMEMHPADLAALVIPKNRMFA